MRSIYRPCVVVAVAVLAVALVATRSVSQEQQPKKPEMQLPPGMTQEQMQEMIKLGTPGPEHAAMKAMAGTFTAECLSQCPGMPDEKTTGKSVNELVLGGRWLQQKFEGTHQGQPFHGIGYNGYNNGKKKYIGTWMDTMSTSMMLFEGTADSSGKVITSTSTFDCPINMKPMTCKTVTTIVSNDKHTFEMTMPSPEPGKDMKMLITYTRVK